MKLDLTYNDISSDAIISLDDLDWFELDDMTDDDLCDGFKQQEWLDDEALPVCDVSDAVDTYVSQWQSAGRPLMWEVR